MNWTVNKTWEEFLNAEMEEKYFQNLKTFVENEYDEKTIFPPKEKIFEALNLTPLPNVKVVIIGQDPYHGIGQAHGLAFSVNDGVKFPPSLRNIFKELQDDLSVQIPFSGNLTHWAQQGVLLLNATLTVQAGKAGSHQKKGWEEFTSSVIRLINLQNTNVVFMLWGAYAQKKCNFIDETKHLVLKAKHPSPLSANFGGWFGEKHFSKANQYLLSKGKEPIQWA